MKARSRWLKSYGNSMLPILHDQDIVEILPVFSKQITVDEIISYPVKQGYITHRVIYTHPKKNWIMTKGDNNVYPDKKIQKKRILGKVNLIYRGEDSIRLDDYYLFQSTYYFEEIKMFKKQLDTQDIQHVFLKGLPVHIYYKGSFPRRDFADCDILFKKEDQKNIHAILTKIGYQRQSSHESPIHQLTKEDVHSFEYCKVRGMFKIIFDIHFKAGLFETKLGSTDALYSPSLSNSFTNELLNQATTVTVLGEKYKILNHSYLIIYLATHIFHHNFKGYHRYNFLANVFKKKMPNILVLSKIAEKYKLDNIIFAVFLLYNKYYLPKVKLAVSGRNLNPQVKKFSENMAKKISIFTDEDLFSSAFNRLYYMYFFSEANVFVKNGVFSSYLFKAIIYLRPVVWLKIFKFAVRKVLSFRNYFFGHKSVKKMIYIF